MTREQIITKKKSREAATVCRLNYRSRRNNPNRGQRSKAPKGCRLQPLRRNVNRRWRRRRVDNVRQAGRSNHLVRYVLVCEYKQNN